MEETAGMTTAELLTEHDTHMRGWDETPPPGMRREADGPLLRVVGLERGYLIGPSELGLEGAALDDLIARQRAYFAARDEDVEWKTFSHDSPADLGERLRAAGFRPEPPETVLVGEAAHVAAVCRASPPAGVVLRRLTSHADLLRMLEMQSEVFGRDLRSRAKELAGQIAAAPEDTVVIAAEADGEVVSGARITFRPGSPFAGLWGGATRADWQGRGVYRALVAARARLAVERGGVRFLHVDASSRSEPILRRLGLRAVTTTTPYVWSPRPR